MASGQRGDTGGRPAEPARRGDSGGHPAEPARRGDSGGHPAEAAQRGLWAAEQRALTIGLAATITFVAAEALAVVTVMPLVARDQHGLSLYGFVFSAFLLGTMVGIVAAGRAADKRGLAVPYIAGIVVFAAGLTAALGRPAEQRRRAFRRLLCVVMYRAGSYL